LFDASAGWEQGLAVAQLLDRLPPGDYTQTLTAIDPGAARLLRGLNYPVHFIVRLAGLNALAAPLLACFARRQGIDLVHAWGPQAAAVAAAAGYPVVLELFDPLLATRHVKLVRTLIPSAAFAVVCSCEWVRRRLIEGGVSGDVCVVVRPGVDFAFINRTRCGPLREQLGATADELLTIVSEPVTRRGGQSEAFWAATLLNHAGIRVRMIVPGRTPERDRIARLAVATPPPRTLIDPGDHHPFEELVTVADALVIAAQGDVSTTAVAWAMAAGAAVIGPAVPSLAELIGHKVNGLLYKSTPGRSRVMSIARLLQDRSSQGRVREAARGQAYELFSLQRFVEQHMRVYHNALRGLNADDGIFRPAGAI